jgi:hypothetical protein
MEQRPNTAGKVCPLCGEWLELTGSGSGRPFDPAEDEAMLHEHFAGHTAEVILEGKS